MANIHPTAIIDSDAQIGADVFIGPYCVIGPGVELEDNVRLVSHVVISGCTKIGSKTEVYPFASLGHCPQDLKYHGEASTLEIGSNNKIREHVTMNPGTEGGGLVTKVGDNCLFMVASHVAHDCQIGNNVILANNATLAGHVTVGDFAIVGGMSGVHQFVRIGEHAMIGGMSAVVEDVIPYGMVKGDRASLAGLNVVGLERRGFAREDIHALRSAYRMMFSSEGTMAERLDDVSSRYQNQPLVSRVVEFIRSRGGRAICQPSEND